MDIVILGCFAALFVSGVCQVCDEDEAIDCFRPMLRVFQTITQSIQSGDVDLGIVADFCPDYTRYLECNNPQCLPPFFQDVDLFLMQSMSYVCDFVIEEIQRYRWCWEDVSTKTDMIACGDYATEILSSNRDPCTFYEELEPCLDHVTLSMCGQEQSQILQGYLFLTNAQQKREFGCELIPPPFEFPFGQHTSQSDAEVQQQEYEDLLPQSVEIRCWDCHSGMSRDEHMNCPINGDLKTSLLTSVTCSQPCFAKTHSWNKEVIYRGCSDGHYIPDSVPRVGYKEDEHGVIWSFCDNNLCNTQDMTSFIDEQT